MARFNEIQVGRYNAVLHKLLSMEEGAPAPQLSGDIVPVIVLENDRDEYRYLGGVRLCQGGHAVAAGGAGTTSKCGLYNPPGSGVLAVASHLHFACDVNARVSLYSTTSALGLDTKLDGMFMDGRQDGGLVVANPFPSVQVDYEDAAGFTGRAIDTWRVLAHQTYQEGCHIVLPPDTGFHLLNTTQNAAIYAGFQWTERHLELSELR